MAAPEIDIDRIPAALRERAQWLVWRFVKKAGAAKPSKMPYYANGHLRGWPNGQPPKGADGKRKPTPDQPQVDQGDPRDRAELVSFDAALAALHDDRWAGLGFAFLPGDGLIGIDLDNVIDVETGEVQERAAGIIAACDSFTEFSPSGRGVHIYCFGEAKSHKSNEIGVEMFCGRQFFTVTGRQFPGSPDVVTAIRPAVVERLHQVIDEARGKHRATGSSAPARQPVEGQYESGLEERSFFARVNSKALHNLAAWVPALLPKAQPYKDGFRVSSADLGRDLQEDLSMVPEGIFDFGTERGKTAIDLVLEWGAPTKPLEAAEWLCAHLGIDPASIGGKRKRTRKAGPTPSSRGAAEPSMQAPSASMDEPPEWLMDGPPVDDLMHFVHDSADFNSQFRRNDKGNIQPSLYNTLHVLEGDPLWRGVLGFNQFSYRIVKRRMPPVLPATDGEWADIDDVRLQVYLTKTYSFEPKKTTVMDAVMQVAHAAPFHPVREYLDALVWDGTPRLVTLLSDCWGALSTAGSAALRREDPGAHRRLGKYLELAGVKWLVGAVARIYKPGCKLDTMLVLEGGQGDFKSTSIRALFGDEWFSDSKLTIGDKDALAQMQGKWAYEMAEMDAHRKADDTAFKQFLTTQVDRVRWHYGKRAEDVPRQCIFVGTTNMEQYGKDETGMRRIWPLEVGMVDLAKLRELRDQLWAEAVALFRQGVTWWVDKRVFVLEPDEEPLIDRPWSEFELFQEQGDHRQNVDAWEEPILKFIADNNKLPYYTTAQIMGGALLLDKARWTPLEQKRVAAILRRLGFKVKKVGPKNARVNGWVREEDQGEAADVPL